MGGTEERTRTTIEVDFISIKMVNENTQITPNIIEATIETLHPSTVFTIIKTKEATKNLQPKDGTQVIPMVK
jgi:hypothetical protein